MRGGIGCCKGWLRTHQVAYPGIHSRCYCPHVVVDITIALDCWAWLHFLNQQLRKGCRGRELSQVYSKGEWRLPARARWLLTPDACPQNLPIRISVEVVRGDDRSVPSVGCIDVHGPTRHRVLERNLNTHCPIDCVPATEAPKQ